MKIFVTGATGYIGKVIAEKLLASGNTVTALVRTEQAARIVQTMGMQSFPGDMADPNYAVTGARNCDAVIHTAFRFEKTDRPFDPGPKAARIVLQALQSELAITRAFFRELAGTNKPFIFSSGTGLFGDTGDMTPDEETVMPAKGLFSIRRRTEQETQEAAQQGIRTVVLRSATVYGRGGSMLVPILLDAARLSGISCYVRGSENNKWSSVHVDDLADLYILALHSAPSGSLFHVSAESGITTFSIAKAVSYAAGLNGETTGVSKEEAFKILGGFAEYWACSNQSSGNNARSMLNWRPTRGPMISEIMEGSYRGSNSTVAAL